MTVAPPPAAVAATGRTATPTVCVALVTFNRKLLLVECLDALLAQTRPVDRIFIIDNGSTDGTADLLTERGYLAQPVVTYIRMQTNSGGAGGFHRGLEIGAGEGYDWIWLMDDDAEPAPDALAHLLTAATTPGVVALANFKVSAEGVPQNVHMQLPSGDLAEHLAGAATPVPLHFSSFVGLMVARNGIARVGLPRREFFLGADDAEYNGRLHRIGSILLVPRSVIRHKEAARKDRIERSFLGIRRERLPLRAFLFRYYTMRNVTVIHGQDSGRLRMLAAAAAEIAKQAAMVLAFRDDHPAKRLHVIVKAQADALRGNFDNDYPFRTMRQL